MTGCPAAVNSAARWRTDSVVHDKAEHGSPRRVGSTNANRAGSSPGSACSARLRPPPARLTRATGAAPDSSSFTPSWILDRDAPEARATAAIPPWPKARASAASTSRAARSSRCGSTASNFAFNTDTTSAAMAIHHYQASHSNRST